MDPSQQLQKAIIRALSSDRDPVKARMLNGIQKFIGHGPGIHLNGYFRIFCKRKLVPRRLHQIIQQIRRKDAFCDQAEKLYPSVLPSSAR